MDPVEEPGHGEAVSGNKSKTMATATADSVPAAPGDSARADKWARYRVWLAAAALGLLTVGLFWPATHCQFLNFDDDRYITSNVLAQHGLAWDTLKFELLNPFCGNWNPVTMLSHVLDCQCYGLNPWGHHLTSLLIHAVNSVLVFLLLRALTGTFWRSACVAALFAWHPLHVESVAWVSERKDVLSTCFGLLSLLAYVRYVRKIPRAEERPGGVGSAFYRSGAYWLAWFWLVLGLLSKPMLVTWPFVMLLLDYWPLQRFEAGRLRLLLLEKVPFFLLTAVFCGAAYAIHKLTGDLKALENLPMGARFENALISYCRYLFKMVWPTDLAVFYPHPGHWPAGYAVLAGILLCGITAFVWAARRGHRYLPMGWFWFLGTLVPVIGLIQMGRLAMADRYSYFPSLGVFIMAVWGLHDLTKHWRRQALTLALAGTAALLACGVLTRQQLSYWKNSETLFRHALAVTADNELARNNLGTALLARGQTDAGIAQLQMAVRLRPDSTAVYNNLGKALLDKGDVDTALGDFQKSIELDTNFGAPRYNLATILAAKGRTNDAIEQLTIAVQVEPDYFEAHNNLAILLSAVGRTNEAIGEFREAVWLYPDYADAHFNFGNLLAQVGRADEAVRQFAEAVRLRPKDAESRFKLAGLLSRQGDVADALSQYQEGLRWDTNNAEGYYKLGNLLARSGRTGEAIGQFEQAIRLKPDFAEAHNNLGSLLSAQRRLPDAIAEFKAAIRARPDYVDAQYNLANALLKSGQADEAIRQFQTVVRLAPNFAPAHYYLGLALAKNGQADDALVQFQEACLLRPGDPMAHNQFGLALQGKGQTDAAIQEFQEALRLRPDDAEASNHLARALEIKSAAGR